jgi:hypothetical protein
MIGKSSTGCGGYLRLHVELIKMTTEGQNRLLNEL